MPNDATLDNIEVKKRTYTSEDVERRLNELLEDWKQPFSYFEEKYGDPQKNYSYAYRNYMGDADFPEDDRTVNDLKKEYENIAEYKKHKEMGLLDIQEDDEEKEEQPPLDSHPGGQEYFILGWKTALGSVRKHGLENVSENPFDRTRQEPDEDD